MDNDSHMIDESGFEDEDAELQRVLRESRQATTGIAQGGVPSAFGGGGPSSSQPAY
jgi:hypothetical protein